MWYAIVAILSACLGVMIGGLLASEKICALQSQVIRKCTSCKALTDALEQLTAARADCRAIEEDLSTVRRSNYQYRNMVERLRNRLCTMMEKG
jgi:hypothetical protein